MAESQITDAQLRDAKELVDMLGDWWFYGTCSDGEETEAISDEDFVRVLRNKLDSSLDAMSLIVRHVTNERESDA